MTSSGRTVAEPTSARSRLARGSALLVMTGVLAGTVGALTAAPAEAVSGTAAGRVFRDFNMNGTFDTTSTTASPAVDVGVSGVSVRAYDKDNNLLVTAQTGATGTYSLTYNTTTATASVRLEFDTPTGMVPSRAGASGATNKTDVQFVSTGVTNADYAVAHPQDFSTSNPSFAFARQVGAIKLDGTAQNTDAGTVFTNPYGARGTTAAVPAVKEATVAQTGAVWGLASLDDDFIFTSSLFKRHAAVGPGGLGAIYLTVPGGATDAAPFTTVANAGTNPRPAAMTTAAYFNDTTAYAQVGKIGLGGMTIAPDHSALYVVNLASKRLVRIPITINASGVPVAGTQTSVAIPAPACAGDLRPFGVSSANGSLWVTQTCAGLAAADLRGYVYKYDYTSNTFGTSAVLEIPLTGSRGFAYSPNQSATWRPWTDATGNSAWPNNVTTISIPQPMLSDVQFDANGDMTIGIKDRFGDQAGYAGSPGGGNNVYEAMGAGDSLRACLNGTASTFTLESNGSCGGRTGSGVGNTDGPGGGEFYSDDFNSGSHDQVSLGGLLQVPGFPLLINTTFDPKSPGSDPEYGTQGYRFFSNTNGSFDAATGWRQVGAAVRSTTVEGRESTYGKAGGMGDLDTLVTTPVEIGNRVWIDTDRDGVQEPGEPGVAGVEVTLLSSAGAVVGTTTTAADGTYYFNDTNATLNGGLVPGAAYRVRLQRATDFASGGALFNFVPTATNAGGKDKIDSDASIVSGSPQISLTAPRFGADHSFDLGFVRTSVTVGDVVFIDTDKDGIQEAGDPGIPNVVVTITGPGGVAVTDVFGNAVTSTTTDAAGTYTFANLPSLPAGQGYTVRIDNAQAALAAFAPTLTGQGTPATDSSNGSAVSGDLVNDKDADPQLDFGFVRKSVSVGDLVFVDADRDGVQDATEIGLAGVTATLVGPTGAAVTNVNGVVVGPVVTGANGSYTFADLPVLAAGQGYTVKVDNTQAALADYVPTTTGQGTTLTDSSNGSAASGPLTANGARDASLDFGFVKKAVSVGDLVFVDTDRDGVQHAGDAGISGVTVTITRTDGAVVRTTTGSAVTSTTTNTTGGYLFGNLEALPTGVFYKVSVDNAQAALAAYVPTVTGAGTPATDSSTGSATSVALVTNGASDLTLDFGFVRPAVTVGDLVFVDTDKDGIQDAGEPGLSGVTVTIVGPNGLAVTNANGAVVGPVTTGANGQYSFTLLPALPAGQSYTIKIDNNQAALADYVPSPAGAGTPATDSSNGSAASGALTTNGSSDTTLDFGFFRKSVSVGDLVFVDTDRDGVQEAGEPGISGVTVTITRTDGGTVRTIGGTTVTSTTTGAAGGYLFGNLEALPAGVFYKVSVDNAQAALAAYVPTVTGAGTPANDSSTGSATSGALVQNGASDLTLDFGFVKPAVSVGDFVFVDADRDGVQDAGEPGLAGVVVTIVGPNGAAVTNVNGNVVGPVTTGANGQYTFGLLPVLPLGQTYTVKVDNSQAALADYAPAPTGAGTPTTDSSNASAASGPLTTDGASDTSLDFGFVKKVVSVGDFVFLDNDRDGVQDAGDTGIQGVTVTITRTDGAVVRTATGSTVTSTTTNASGGYLFGNLEALPAGTHYVTRVDNAQAALNGFVPTLTGQGTTPNDSSNGSAESVNLIANGASDLTLDFGFVRPAVSVGDLVFADTNGNGIQNAGEPGIAGVTVTIVGPNGLAVTNVNGAVVGPVATGTDGQYAFQLLPVLPVGQGYTVRVDNAQAALDGYVPTLTGQGAVATDSSNGSATSGNVATNGATDTTLDFGFVRESVSVGDFVWLDTNRNGIQNAGEPGIQGVTVTITRTDGVPVRTVAGATVTSTTTSAAGAYLFPDLETLPAGTHYVARVDNGQAALAAYVSTTTGQGTPATDSSNGSAESVNLTVDGASDLMLDFGFVKPAVTVGDHVFVDANGNGIQDAGDTGLQGVRLTVVGPGGNPVTDVNGTLVGAATSGANGQYTFDLLPALAAGQSYTVRVDNGQTALLAHVPTLTGQGTAATDSSNGSAASAAALTANGASDRTLDFGFRAAGPALSLDKTASAIDDVDGNGPDAGDRITYGFRVTNTGNVPLNPVTVADPKVGPVTCPTGSLAVGATVTCTPVVYTLTQADVTAGAVDNTATATGTAPNAAKVTDDDSTATPVAVQKVRVGDFVWVDTDRDGIQDAGENGIANVRLTLVGPGGAAVTDVFGNVVGAATTDAAGRYTFADLPALATGQSYTVRIDNTQAALAAYVPTATGQGTPATDSSTGSATSGNLTTDGASDLTLDFGFKKSSVSVGDLVFVDTNGNGTQDAGEPGLPGIRLTIVGPGGQPVTNVDGTTVGAATTDGLGRYSFDGLPTLPAGQGYTVKLDGTQVALNGYTPAPTGQGTPATDSSNGSATSGDLSTSGASDKTLDFGFVRDDQDGLANLKVTKSVDRATPAVGEVVTYTLTVTNDGDAAATNVVLKDVLPSQVTFVSADAPCTQASGTVSCELGTLAAGQTRTVTVKARVDNVPAGTTEERHNLDVQKAEVVLDVEAGQTGTASVTCPSGSTVLDGSARVVSSGADVAITESRATSLTTWTATLVNQGTQRAQNKVFALCVVNQTETVNGHSHQLQVSPAAVTQTAAVPAGSSDLTLSCAAGQTPVQPGWKLDGAADVQTSYPSGSSSWTFGVVNEGAATSGLFSIRCLKNQVSTVNGHSHDLALAELFRTVTVPAGQSVDVVLDCADSALGNQGAKGVVAGFDLPAGLLNLGHEPQPIRRVYTLSNTTSGPLDADLWLLCLGTRTAGHDGSGDVVNAASVTTTSPERTVSDNVASARFRVTATAPAPVDKANLSVTKTVGDTTPRVGDTVSYTLRVTNNGDVAAAGVVLTDALPSGVTFGSATAPCTLNGSTVRCELGSVAPGATKTVTITATVDAAPSASSSHDHYLDVQKVEQHVALTAGETRTVTVDCAPGYLATDGSGRVDQIDQGTGTADAVRIIRSAAADEDSWSVTMVNTATGSAQGKAFVVCTKKTTDVADGHTHDLAHGAPVTATRALTVGATSVTLTCATGRPIAPSYSVPADASVRQTYPVGTDGWAFTVDSASAGSADFSIRCLETRVSTADGHQHDLVLTPLTQTTTVAPGQTVEITSTCAGDAKGVVAGFQMDLGLVQLGNDPRPIIRVFRFHNPTSSPLDVDVSLLCLMSRTSANSGSGTVVNTAYATTSTPETTTGDNTASASFKVDTSAPAPVASPASTVVTVAPRQAFVSTAVKCSGTVACTGTAVLVAARTQRVAGTLVRKGAVLARATYKVTSGRTATVKMRPSAFGKKVLASRTVKTAQVKVGGKTRTVTIRR